jgi:hypothetical protein
MFLGIEKGVKGLNFGSLANLSRQMALSIFSVKLFLSKQKAKSPLLTKKLKTMNDILENRFSMMIGVQTFGNENAATLATVASIPPLYTQLSGYVDAISAVAGPATLDITGVAVDKGLRRAELTDIVLKVSDGFSAYCYLTGDNENAEFFDETRASLERFRDTILYTYARNLALVANPVIGDLADYNVLPADMTALDDASQFCKDQNSSAAKGQPTSEK